MGSLHQCTNVLTTAHMDHSILPMFVKNGIPIVAYIYIYIYIYIWNYMNILGIVQQYDSLAPYNPFPLLWNTPIWALNMTRFDAKPGDGINHEPTVISNPQKIDGEHHGFVYVFSVNQSSERGVSCSLTINHGIHLVSGWHYIFIGHRYSQYSFLWPSKMVLFQLTRLKIS